MPIGRSSILYSVEYMYGALWDRRRVLFLAPCSENFSVRNVQPRYSTKVSGVSWSLTNVFWEIRICSKEIVYKWYCLFDAADRAAVHQTQTTTYRLSLFFIKQINFRSVRNRRTSAVEERFSLRSSHWKVQFDLKSLHWGASEASLADAIRMAIPNWNLQQFHFERSTRRKVGVHFVGPIDTFEPHRLCNSAKRKPRFFVRHHVTCQWRCLLAKTSFMANGTSEKQENNIKTVR